MKILFVSTKKNSDPTERELYEMDLMNEILGFKRSLLDLGLLTVANGTPAPHTTSLPLYELRACTVVLNVSSRAWSRTRNSANTTDFKAIVAP